MIPLLVVITYGWYTAEPENAKKVFQWLLSAYGFGLLVTFAYGLIDNPGSWESVLQSLAFPLIMTICVFPYLKSLILFERCRFLMGVKSKKVTAIEYGDDWPLIVAQAKLCCKHGAVWVEVDGKRYGLNGWAEPLLKQRGVPIYDLRPIWRDQPGQADTESTSGCDGESFRLKVGVGRLLDDGRALEKIE